MPSARQRELFDNRVKELFENGLTEKEIAEELGCKVEKVGDSRRRLGIFKIGHWDKDKTEERVTHVTYQPERKPKLKPYVYKGIKYWNANEFFGIWEY